MNQSSLLSSYGDGLWRWLISLLINKIGEEQNVVQDEKQLVNTHPHISHLSKSIENQQGYVVCCLAGLVETEEGEV